VSDATVRDATAADAGVVARIQVASWRAGYAGLLPDDVLAGLSEAELRLRWAARLPTAAPASCLVTGAPPVGFVTSGPSLDEADHSGSGQVYALYVDPAHWGHGLGRMLLSGALTRLRDAGFASAHLWVMTTNEAARGFYEHEGWTASGRTQVERMYDTDVPVVEFALALGG
jgi:ribosomal protein S18 acetylase RimI-like enzyme